jgi:hypothetical protein
VGHKLPIYFLNAVRSVQRFAPGDDVLVIDNASDLPGLTEELSALESRDPRLRVMRRRSNDLSRNTKVGGLYDAYRGAIDYAMRGDYDLLHLIQGDMQLLWWDEQIVAKAVELYDRFPGCVNIHMCALPQDRRLSPAVKRLDGAVVELTEYGLSDTGLYHLARWRDRGLRFHDSEQAHARTYRDAGMRVLCHPWPAVAPVPWPAVVRNGRVKGREVVPPYEFLLRPLTAVEIAGLLRATAPVWLEAVCVPWGWACLNPMSVSALESIEYWVYRYRDFGLRGWVGACPRWDRRGLRPGCSIWRVQRRPRIWQVALLPPWYGLKQLVASR